MSPGVGIEAVLFDWDGLIEDCTEMADAAAWREEWERAGVPIGMAEYAGYWAAWSWLRLTPMISRLAAAAPGIDRPLVEARRRARYEELCAALPARPGIAEWIKDAHAAGLTVAVISNDADGRVPTGLKRLGLDRDVTAVISAGDGIARKPQPDLYWAALARLGVSADRAVAVADSPHGLAAARAAGMRAIGVPNQLTRLLPGTYVDEHREIPEMPRGLSAHVPDAAAPVLVPDPAATSLAQALASAAACPPPPGRAGEQDPERRWACGLIGPHGEPWHWASARMLHVALEPARAAAARAAFEGIPQPVEELTIPRLPVILGALAILRAGFLTRAATLERVLVQVILDLLGNDDAARATAQTQPIRMLRGPQGEQGDPALLPDDRAALDCLLGQDPAEWDAIRQETIRMITAAAEPNRDHAPSGRALTLHFLAPYNGYVKQDWVDHPDQPAIDPR
jgi:putative hydrolase of the HAD superfamily